MSEGGKWKDKLLSSSVPMEFQVAKLLVKHGFSIHSDYSYTRTDAESGVDCSVDLEASSYLPFRKPNGVTTTLHLLVECKHRHRNNKWLFFQDPNRGDLSPVVLGHTLRVVDNFSAVLLSSKYSTAFDKDSIFCLKGVEIDLSSGNVYESEIKHGLSQLQYALPRLVGELIETNVGGHPDDCYPFLFCPILLTTSEILIASTEMNLEKVEQAANLKDFANPVPWIVMYCDQTPAFQRHRSATCSVLRRSLEWDFMAVLDETRRQAGEYNHLLPTTVCKDLSGGYSRGLLSKFFGQTIVCSMASFESLLTKIKTVARRTEKTRRPLPLAVLPTD